MVDESDSAAGGVSFAEALRDFSRSHAAILIRLEQLRRLPRRLADGAPDRRGVRADAAALLVFFRDTVFEHHQAEEQALFPAVARSAAGEQATQVASLAARLAREHRQIEADWKSLEPALARIARGKPGVLDEGIVSRLCDRYAAHAQFEETGYLPLAATILDAQDQASLALTLHARYSTDIVPGRF